MFRYAAAKARLFAGGGKRSSFGLLEQNFVSFVFFWVVLLVGRQKRLLKICVILAWKGKIPKNGFNNERF
jgi:hypothetical protein